ncbi:MAG TPA: iron-sulfur cluster insertion protein ErpA [Rhodospirillales bacterium]|nr:iron-sulfur cluster insertion protein ErpA [Rhodospirillales bacterium]
MADHSVEQVVDEVRISDAAARRIAALVGEDGTPGILFRVSVSGGGCSGFQYGFSLDDQRNPDDKVFRRHDVGIVVDEVSLDLLRGSEVDYVEDLIGSYFAIRNPNATSTCGCGSSFSI